MNQNSTGIEMLDPAAAAAEHAAEESLTAAALATYDSVSSGLAALRARHEGVVYEVATTKGMDEAKAARLEIRGVRFDVQRVQAATKKQLNDLKRTVDDRAAAIIGQIKPLEEAVDSQIKREEERKAAEKAAREQAEREAQDALHQRLDAIRAIPLDLLNATGLDIEAAIVGLRGVDLTSFAEFEPAALRASAETLKRLSEMHKAAVDREQIEADRKAIEAQQAAERAEQQRILAEQRAENERLQAELKRQQDEAAEAERQLQRQVEADAALARAEQAKRDQEAREVAARAQAEIDALARAQAAERAEAERKLALITEARRAGASAMYAVLIAVMDWHRTSNALPGALAQQIEQALAAANPEVK